VKRFSTHARVASPSPRTEYTNADHDIHEHPTEWPDVISVEPHMPHPSDPVEVSTEPRTAHPERHARRRARNRCPTMRPRLNRWRNAPASR
jgi:hypothetical protein